MAKVTVMNHPLIQHKVGKLRNKNTGAKEFRELVSEISMLMCYEATRELPLMEVEIETPLVKTNVKQIEGKTLGIVPILRAGLGMVDAILNLVPTAKVGHVGLYRDPETLEPVEYYCKLPYDAPERDIFVLDPMLATGGSACDAIKLIKQKGVKKVHFLCLIAAPEGVERLKKEHPDVDIYVASLDERLNEHSYILPGLGDAGDRLFGTK